MLGKDSGTVSQCLYLQYQGVFQTDDYMICLKYRSTLNQNANHFNTKKMKFS